MERINWSASKDWEELIGYNTVPNYPVGRKPERDVCAESCSLADSSVQGPFSDKAAKASHLCSGTLSRQSQASEK